jgi:hypothetical protein
VRADNGDLPRLAVVPVTLVFLIALIAACGSSQAGSSASAHLETPTSETSATPIVTADPGDPTLLPVPADVAFLQAPTAIQSEWRAYYATGAITVVPNSTVPFTRPATPPVVDATNGVVSSTTAQQWGDALMRETAWENWAITANQVGLFDNGIVSASQAEPGLVLPQGASGFRIVGPRWPSSLRLVPLSSASQTFLGTTDGYAFVFTFNQGWSVKAVFPNGTTQAITDQGAAAGTSVFVAGKLTTVANFGQLWYGSASFLCSASEPTAVLSICAG